MFLVRRRIFIGKNIENKLTTSVDEGNEPVCMRRDEHYSVEYIVFRHNFNLITVTSTIPGSNVLAVYTKYCFQLSFE